VHHVLSNPDLQRQLGCRTIHAVSSYFGFYSRNHFSRDYRALFGESPRDTLQQSAA
jgi:AraC family ethanolamine operon transcriptional activator